MRVVFANTFDTRGGAARAALRLFEGVSGLDGVFASMVVQEKAGQTPGVVRQCGALPTRWTSKWDQAALKADHPDRERVPFSVNRVPSLLPHAIRGRDPEVVHLHWLHCGFVRIEQLRTLRRPLVWTIHDMWAFTGVCHYSGDCRRYLSGCGRCPLLGSRDGNDVSRRVFQRKRAVFADLDLTVVSPSRWLADLARSSPLLGNHPVRVIPNGLDVARFSPMDKGAARRELGLPQDRPLLLFGADFAMADRRKGLHLLLDALSSGLAGGGEVAVFGCDAPVEQPDLPMKVHWLGKIHDDSRLVAAYSAADLFAAPSLEENLSNAVMEALACGAPAAAFDVGGMGDMIDDGRTGFLVPKNEGAGGLGRALDRAFADPGRLAAMGREAREVVCRRFDIRAVAAQYRDLYEERITPPGK